jgi:hypothetical protein
MIKFIWSWSALLQNFQAGIIAGFGSKGSAGLVAYALTGIAIYAAFAGISSYLLRRWHESAAIPGG